MLRINPTRTRWRLLSLFTAATVALTPASPLIASQAMEQLFGILKTKGSITQAEHDMLITAMRADEAKAATTAPVAAAATTTVPANSSGGNTTTALEQRLAAQEARIMQLESSLNGTKTKVDQVVADINAEESKVEKLEDVLSGTKSQIEELASGRIADNTSPATISKAEIDELLADKWYERLKPRGYIQFRGYSMFEGNGADYHQPNDSSIANDTNFFGIRRGRFIWSGDITSHLYTYIQADYMAGVGGVNALQARDVYADISLDPAREFRARIGLSKVPYGWSNLQSSQNRLALERTDSINSAAEGERDLGVYLMWAPYEIRNRFKDLVKMGLRGSGDYGLAAIGAYNGQGINNNDRNGAPHLLARVSYPFELDNGQFFELGINGYTGRFVPTASRIARPDGTSGTPTFEARGVMDQRVGISAILYPQPFGLEAEWNWGNGPTLSSDRREIESGKLMGGYIQASYRHIFADQAELIPFVRYQYNEGGRKFATNAPGNNVDEIAVGLRYVPYPELELTLQYAHGSRTNTAVAPYEDHDGSYIGLQAQINF
jgi:hypothetical protein